MCHSEGSRLSDNHRGPGPANLVRPAKLTASYALQKIQKEIHEVEAYFRTLEESPSDGDSDDDSNLSLKCPLVDPCPPIIHENN